MATEESSGEGSYRAMPNTSVLLAFLISVFLGGANAVAVRFTVEELEPFWGAALRFAAAAIIFAIIVLVRRIPLPRGKVLGAYMVIGILNFGLSYALIYFAIRELTAGFTMVILALTPLLTFIFAVLQRLESFSWQALLGTMLALGGIALAFTGQSAGGAPLWAVLFMVGGAACFAEATVLLKKQPRISPIAANAVGMGVAALLLAVLSLVTGETWMLPDKSETLFAVLYLVLFGSVTLFYLVVYTVQRWKATASSYVVVLAPFVTVPLGALLADEQISTGLIVGGLLVLAGVFLGAMSKESATQPAVKETAPKRL